MNHRHNNYSCYIHVVNKTDSTFHLVNSKATKGTWAAGTPPAAIRPGTDCVVELNDPKGPHGSEGWCTYRVHHPQRSNPVTFKLKFGDPYWAVDDNYLYTATHYPKALSLNVPEYHTKGHPFVAYVEVNTLEIKGSRSRKSGDSVALSVSSQSDDGQSSIADTLSEVLPEYKARSDTLDSLKKEVIPVIRRIDSDEQSETSFHKRNDSAVAIIDLADETPSVCEEDSSVGNAVKVNGVESTDIQSEVVEVIEVIEIPPQIPPKPESEVAANVIEETATQATDKTAESDEPHLSETTAREQASLESNQYNTDTDSRKDKPLNASVETTPTETTEPPTEPEQAIIDTPHIDAHSNVDMDAEEEEEDLYMRVMESQLESIPTSTPTPTPISTPAPTKQITSLPLTTSPWSATVKSWSRHARFGIVATVFLASYGFTMARVSGGLFFGVRRR